MFIIWKERVCLRAFQLLLLVGSSLFHYKDLSILPSVFQVESQESYRNSCRDCWQTRLIHRVSVHVYSVVIVVDKNLALHHLLYRNLSFSIIFVSMLAAKGGMNHILLLVRMFGLVPSAHNNFNKLILHLLHSHRHRHYQHQQRKRRKTVTKKLEMNLE